MSIEKRKLWSVSPSAVDAYLKCPRSWYYSYVKKMRGPAPAFLARGTSIHAAILDHWLAKGEMIVEHENDDAPGVKHAVWEFTQAAKDHLPKPLTDEYWIEKRKADPTCGLLIEQSGTMMTWQDPDGTYGPEWRQFLDLVECEKDYAILTDIKTSSDPGRYAKTPDELSVNCQLVANSRWIFLESDYKEITIRHLYLGTKTKRPKAFPVSTVVTREHVEREWQKILLTVRQMDAWARLAPENADPLPPNTGHCNEYGGCQYKINCYGNVSDLTTLRRPTSKMNEGEKMGLLDQMMKRAGAISGAGATAAVQAGIVITSGTPAPAPVSGTVTTSGAAPVTATIATAGPTVGKVEPIKEAPAAKPSILSLLKAPKVILSTPEVTDDDAASAVKAAYEPLTPAKAQDAAVAAGYPVAPPPGYAYDPNGIVPPDAPSPISTPEEIAAANPEPEQKVETTEPTKRKRRTKLEMEAARAAETQVAAQGEPAAAPLVPSEEVQKTVETDTLKRMLEQLPASVSNLTPAEIKTIVADVQAAEEVQKTEESPEQDEIAKIRAILTTPDSVFPCGTEVVFIDCVPGKGWVGEQPVDAIELIHAFNSLAASSAGVADYRLIRYESKGYLATAIKVYAKGLPKVLYVDSKMSGADVLLETIIPYCKLVFRGVR